MADTLQLLIAGEFTEGTGSEAWDVTSPVTGEHIYSVPKASPADIDRAVAAARAATDEMRHWSPFERAELCLRIHELWQERVDDVARRLTLEQGKPFAAEAIDDISESGDYFQIAAEDVKRLAGSLLPTTDRNVRMFTVPRPVGVWANITPWNFPVMIPMETVGPGLATGNAIIVKPPHFTCWALLTMAEVFVEAGVPKGAISIIPGDGAIGDQLVTHDGVDGISFTGSSETGRVIASRMGLKRSVMEMSGNGPLIVTGDARVDEAAAAAVYGAYYNAGQVCCATERAIVVADVHDEFVEAAVAAAGDVVLGDPFNEATTMGPLNNEATAAKMDRHLADATDKGAEVLVGGGRAPGFPTDLYYELTVVDRVPEASALSREESFGPVVPIIIARDDEDAVAIANRSNLGLQAAVFTESLRRAWWYADRIRSGTVIVNDSTDFWETFQPFGGAAGTDTGWGRQQIEDFTDTQTVVFSLGDD